MWVKHSSWHVCNIFLLNTTGRPQQNQQKTLKSILSCFFILLVKCKASDWPFIDSMYTQQDADEVLFTLSRDLQTPDSQALWELCNYIQSNSTLVFKAKGIFTALPRNHGRPSAYCKCSLGICKNTREILHLCYRGYTTHTSRPRKPEHPTGDT